MTIVNATEPSRGEEPFVETKAIWYFLALLTTALVMGMSFAHTLEAPAKLKIEGPFWVGIQHTLYRTFASIGGAVELGAIVLTIALAVSLRREPPFALVTVAVGCLVIAFFPLWVVVVNGVNRETATWTPEALPPDWRRWRHRWEMGHVFRFVLHLIGFAFLLAAALSAYGPRMPGEPVTIGPPESR
jgi:hypothetical protein